MALFSTRSLRELLLLVMMVVCVLILLSCCMDASVAEARPLVSLGSNGKALTSWDMEDLSLEQQERILTLGRKLDLVTRHLLWRTNKHDACFVCSLLKEGGWGGGEGGVGAAAVACRRRQDGYWSLLKTKYGSICKCFPRKMNGKAGSLASWCYLTSFVAESSKGNKRSWPLPSSSISS